VFQHNRKLQQHTPPILPRAWKSNPSKPPFCTIETEQRRRPGGLHRRLPIRNGIQEATAEYVYDGHSARQHPNDGGSHGRKTIPSARPIVPSVLPRIQLNESSSIGAPRGRHIPQYRTSSTVRAIVLPSSVRYVVSTYGIDSQWSLHTNLPQNRHTPVAASSQCQHFIIWSPRIRFNDPHRYPLHRRMGPTDFRPFASDAATVRRNPDMQLQLHR